MTTHAPGIGASPRLAGARGISAALLLIVAPIAGADPGAVLWASALVPRPVFLAGLASLLAADAKPPRWLARVIPVAGSIANSMMGTGEPPRLRPVVPPRATTHVRPPVVA
jgi:hypothetical protein